MAREEEFAESIQYIPENFQHVESAETMPEYEPEIPDEARLSEQFPVEEIEGETVYAIEDENTPAATGTELESEAAEESDEVDNQPKVDLAAIQATLDQVQKRLEKAEARAGYWQRQAEKGVAEEPKETPHQPQVEEVVAKEPKYEDFDTDEAYYQAMVDYRVEAKLKEFSAQQEARENERALQNEKNSFERTLFDTGMSKYTDFVEVVSDPTLPITNEIVDILREAEKPSEVIYYLGKNPKEAVRISRLSPLAAAREIGKIESKIVADEETAAKAKANAPPPSKPKPVVSNAPPPINPIRGGHSVSVHKDPEKMTNEEYRNWRRGKKG